MATKTKPKVKAKAPNTTSTTKRTPPVVEVTPEMRELRRIAGSKGGHIAHSRHTGEEMTRAARAGFFERFLRHARQEAPEGTSEAELLRRAEHLRAAFMKDLALARHRKRREREEAGAA